MQTEKSGTLGTGNDQTIFTAIPINDKATRWQGGGESRNHDGSGNGFGIGKEGDPSPTLTAGDRHGVICLTPWEAQSQKVYDVNGVSQTLCAYQNSGMNREAILCAGFKAGQGAQAGGIGYSEEVSPTLNAECGGNKPAVAQAAMAFDTTQITSKVNGSQPEFGKPCHTLNANAHVPCVALDMTHACDVIRECGEQVPALQARMCTGGNQEPLTYQDVTGTLSPGAHAGSYNGQDAYNDMLVCGASPDVAHALRAKANCAYRENAETYPVQNMVVRRLTPMECERLQGFPECMEMDVEEMTKDEYIAVNIATGQIVVDCESGEIYTTKGPGGVRLKEPKKLDGSNVNGYKVVSIRNGQTKMQCRVHRIVWIARNGVIPNGCVVDHINNDKTDNRICNLQLLTAEENSHKAWQDGRYLMGDDSPSTKLPVSRRKEIVELYKSGEYTMRQLANDFGISKSRIHQIVKTSGWTDIGEWTDEKGKKHKDADSPRYKALGNSIALPFWDWMLRRMARYLPVDATLGSLFDGIAGFNVCWARIHGAECCRWSSEIEQFPIAVTKKHFGDEEAGKEGDFEKFFGRNKKENV